MEERIIDPVPRELLAQELTPERCLRHTNKRANEIYVVTYQNAPNVVREIGRLREIAFRAAGGGTGKACDLDEFDTMDVPYRQLIVWNPETVFKTHLNKGKSNEIDQTESNIIYN